MMKNTPGPRAPPDSSRPSLKMTALSYSWGEVSKSNRDKMTFNSSAPHWDRGPINKMSFAARQSGYKIASLGWKNVEARAANSCGKLQNNKADLDNLDRVEEGEGERDEDQEEGEDCQDVGDHARALLAH